MKRAILLLIVFSLAATAHAQLFKGLFGKKKNEIVVTDTVPGMKRLQEVMNLIQSQYVSDHGRGVHATPARQETLTGKSA